MKRSDIKPGDVFTYEARDAYFYREFDGGSGLSSHKSASNFQSGKFDDDVEVERVFEYGAAKPDTKPDGPILGGDLSAQPHYTSLSPEPIDVIEGWGLGFRLGNAVKYLARAGRKPGQPASKDLAKAIQYIRREINALNGTKSW